MSRREQTQLHTGLIWDYSPRIRAQRVRRVCEAILQRYGLPRLGNPESPIDDLIYIILSNKSSPTIVEKVFLDLHTKFASWDELANVSQDNLASILRPAGLGSIKSKQILRSLHQIRLDFGKCDLSPLADRSQDFVHRYLTKLSGISDKVAKCIMLYTLGYDVLPVDGHVHKVACRLGWTTRKRADQSHQELEALVPPSRRYAFHVGCIVHGREVCKSKNPKCEDCCISQYCYFA